MNYFFYIIYSPSKNKFYIGVSHNPDFRLSLHNYHFYKSGFTKIATDWELKLTFVCSSKIQALKLEAFIKKMKSKTFITKILENPKILNEIVDRNKW